MTQLGAAYETLADDTRRIKYDAILSSSQRAKQSAQPAQQSHRTSSSSNDTTRMWQNMWSRARARDWSSRTQEKTDQARREDDEYWSGPTYYHSATNRGGWGEQCHSEQSDRHNCDRNERHRADCKEARREAKDNGYCGRPTSPQEVDPDWSDRVQREYQERLRREEKERSDLRKANRERSEKEWQAELLLLLPKIINIQVDIYRTGASIDDSRRATKVCHS